MYATIRRYEGVDESRSAEITNKANENLPTPLGWLVTAEGKPSTDPREVSKGGFMTPLGGTPEGSSHKGYGLGAMVNILSSALSGGLMVTDPTRNAKPGPIDAISNSTPLGSRK